MRRPDLNGVGVLVTRPARQAGPLCELIEAAGGQAIRLPLLTIAPPQDNGPALALVGRLAHYDLAIFISPNAVEYGLDLLAEQGLSLPAGVRLAAVGAGSARVLHARTGRAPDLLPAGRYDSEGLLTLPQLQRVDGWRIVIFRGEGGRETLAETLCGRGANVEYAEVYRRLPPEAGAAERLQRLLMQGAIDVVSVTSSEGLRNLVELAGGDARVRLLALPLVVMSERTAVLAASLGFMQPALVVTEASDNGVIEAVARWTGEAGEKTDG